MRLAAAVVMRSGMLTTSLCWMVDVSGPQNDSVRSGACGPEGDPVCGGDHPLGGQAVLEGVMMRGRRSWGLAVRRPDGQITLCSYPLSSLSERSSVLRVPVVRGVWVEGADAHRGSGSCDGSGAVRGHPTWGSKVL